MSMFFRMSEGDWSCRSEIDPRWNMGGRGYVGLMTMPDACRLAIDAKKKELGEEPPSDLEYEYMKD